MNKIFIQTLSNDGTSKEVIRWIDYYGKAESLETIYDICNIDSVKLLVSDNALEIGFNKHTLTEKDQYWYRRGMLNFNTQCNSDYPNVNTYLWNKHLAPVKSFMENLNFANQINCFSVNQLEKMSVLRKWGNRLVTLSCGILRT